MTSTPHTAAPWFVRARPFSSWQQAPQSSQANLR
eukprot:CAMPEP_0185787472 /NCGR_PEP_ID=MMETSP1174-20130828/140829_1 /TAXON_ID=35687 /ORGANISM="Dictyocha speculum, Strain CCMP1381" /LENGTH=33 /DNA_ID= /DNA_START= /DNA_END= /DNA_ORIENTATION=